MHIGVNIIFQGLDGPSADRDVYRKDLNIADMAEPLGFDSIWATEHHFTDYTLSPQPLQFLSYMAGRTTQVKLGTMVVVLPWHSPMRVAEQAVLLDNLAPGRLILGIGRGLGRVEFEGFNVKQDESRAIFQESAKALLGALDSGHCEADGPHVHQARRAVRPSPFLTFQDRVYASSASPESSQIIAQLGLGLIIVPQRPWPVVMNELTAYRETFLAANGFAAPPPLIAGWSFVHDDPDQSMSLGRKYLGTYYNATIEHYELSKKHLIGMKGYETHAEMQHRHSREGGADELVNDFIALHPLGTPDQVVEKLAMMCEMVGAGGFIGTFSFGGMDAQTAEQNMRLFAREVLPRARCLPGPSLLFEVGHAERRLGESVGN